MNRDGVYGLRKEVERTSDLRDVSYDSDHHSREYFSDHVGDELIEVGNQVAI